MPQISIILATYNGATYLREQMKSILCQTYQDFELIIRDDGSTDATLELIAEYAAQDPRIKIMPNTGNLGINENFYTLMEEAQGEYVAISDQDDIWEHDKLEILLQYLGGADLAYTDSQLIDAEGSSIGISLIETRTIKPKEGRNIMSFFYRNTVSGHACLFRRELVSRIVETGRQAPTMMYDMVVATAASFGEGVRYYAERPLTFHRIHTANNHNKMHDSLHSKRRKHENFLTRKKVRFRKKVESLKEQLTFFRTLLTEAHPEVSNAIPKPENIDSYLSSTFINVRLLIRLRKDLDAKWSEALNLSAGISYLLIFKLL